MGPTSARRAFVAREAEVAEIFKIPLTEALSLASYMPLDIERHIQTRQIGYRLGQHIRPPTE